MREIIYLHRTALYTVITGTHLIYGVHVVNQTQYRVEWVCGDPVPVHLLNEELCCLALFMRFKSVNQIIEVGV